MEKPQSSMIHVGNMLDKTSCSNLKDLISSILKTAKDCHTDREVVLKALDVIVQVSEIKNITITNNSFSTK